MRQKFWAMTIGIIMAIGCGLGCSASTSNWRDWAQRDGGVMQDSDSRSLRAQEALCRLGGEFAGHRQIHVLDSSTLCAHAWPDGTLFITRGLVDSADDDELCAAIAHELGHLINDGRLAVVASLRGGALARPADSEAAADATGARVLQQRGIDPAAMGRLLRKVERDPGIGDACRSALERRAALLAADLPGRRPTPP